ncbi:uncharacterized protein PB18E9.04c-like [Myzus persicae]|uniref:uncharacterized protein PB18E9.04c-like n=1 Tax=Myzus persicae TaxID=13164 RepID=UPI000B939E06|nr:uncharacterized protein PB18E9.04c-like [Myzus persicae]
MTPFSVILVTALFSTQVMQAITQPKKYRCISLRPLPQLESEPTSPWILRRPASITKSSSTASKSPASGSKSPSSIINSPSTVSKPPSSAPKSPSSVPKSSSSATKSSSTVQKVTSTVTNSSRTTNRLPPDSFSLFKLPLKLISSLLVPLIPTKIRQNTTSIISPLFSFQMPLTFSTIHHSNNLPCNTNNSPVPCNSLPGNTNTSIDFNPLPGISNNIPISFNSIPGNTNILPNPCNTLPGNTNNLPPPCNSLPCNTNTLPTPCNSLPGNTNSLPTPCNSLPSNINTPPTPCNPPPGNTNTSPTPCNSLPGNTNTVHTPCNSLPGNKNTSTNPCNSIAGNTNNSNNVLCDSLLGHSHKSIIYNWFCNYFLNKIQNVSCNTPSIEVIPTSSEPYNPPATDNPTETPSVPSDFTVTPTVYSPTEDTPNDNSTPNDNTPNDNTPNDNTPNDNTPNDNIPNDNIPISTPHYSIPPCTSTSINKIHSPCLRLIHSTKPKPCSVPVTHPHSHIPLKHCPPNHASCSPSHSHFNSLFNPTTYKSNGYHVLNPQEKILLKLLNSLISNSNLRSPSRSK